MNRLAFVPLLGLALLLNACSPYPAMSSGHVGCSPAEITITDQRMAYGGATTWTAECQGRVFYCTEMKSGGGTEVAPSSQVSCTPAAEPSEPAATVAAAPPAAETEEPTGSPSPASPPEKAVGFTFAQPIGEAQAACEEAGHEWLVDESNPDRFTCSGTPVNVGLPTASRAEFCGGQLCSLLVNVEFDADAPNAEGTWNTIYGALRKQYGDPTKTDARIPGDCANKIVSCVADDRMKWKAFWDWDGGEQVAAMFAKKGDKPVLLIRYKVPVQVNSSAF